MYHQVPWNKEILDNFIKYGELSELEEKIIRLRAKDTKATAIALSTDTSTATVARTVVKLKNKYDMCVKKYPELFPKRQINKSYEIVYSHFLGSFIVKTDDLEYVIDFQGKEFTSLDDVKSFVISTIEGLSDVEFGTLKHVHVSILMSFDWDITAK